MTAAPPGIEIRTVHIEEVAAVLEAAAVPFGFDVTDAFRERFVSFTDPHSTVAAFEGASIVGTSGVFPYRVTVPGGTRLPTAGVTLVTVLPTHRRRGVLSAMMHRTLSLARERGDVLGALWASEEPIYGRYGFGEAVPGLRWTLERSRAALRTESVPGMVCLIDRDEALRTFPAIHEEMCLRRHGMFSRSADHWDRFVLWDPEEWRRGATARRYVTYREGPDALGYAWFRSQAGDDGPTETIVGELHALTPAAYAGLWQFLLGIDLVTSIRAANRPMDEPLRWLLADRWALDSTPGHGMWIRLIDVAAALAARTYATSGKLVIEITDASCPWNAGRFELAGGSDGAECARTSSAPDLALDVATLGAAYMGGRSLIELADAGLVEGDVTAVMLAARMMSTVRPPWSPEEF